MILIDYNQVLMASISIQMKDKAELDEGLVRHMALNSIRQVRNNHKDKFGEVVICADSSYSWRRDEFPYYKQSRRDGRKSDDKDWHAIFTVLNNIRDELRDNFPYPVIHVEKAEADDVIGVLCTEFGNTTENILIYSGDKDFAQLQEYKNVYQYNPGQKKWVDVEDPNKYLKEHIIRGDSTDGIPNFLSDDDTFVSGASQKRIYASKVSEWLEQEVDQFTDETTHWKRNQQMIDLSMIPAYIWTEILKEYDKETQKENPGNILGYMREHNLKNLMQNAQDFITPIDNTNKLF